MQLTPSLSTFSEQYNHDRKQLVYMTLPADLETPVSAMLKLQDQSPYHFLFESVEGGAVRGRYSFIGLDPDMLWKVKDGKASINRNPADTSGFEDIKAEPFDSLREILDETKLDIPDNLPPMAAGMFGYMGYDMVRLMEKLPDNNPDVIGIPDSIFMRPKIIVVFDSVKDMAIIITPVYPKEGISAEDAYAQAKTRVEKIVTTLSRNDMQVNRAFSENETAMQFTSNITREAYHAMVERAKEYILAGDVFQVVPGQRFKAQFDLPPFALYRSLRHLNPSPFLFYMHIDGFTLVGSSPEILARLRERKITNRPLAGTRKRGASAEEDAALAKELLADAKERAEHLMLVDLGRNDVGRVAKTGSVKVTEMMVIEYYSHVMHISSNVEGEIAPGKDALDALIAAFPVGTVSGAPKIRAMEIIDELETERRSFYAGGVGYISAGGDMDICIALRTALVKDKTLYIQSGGGVVADSDPEAEYQESCNKAKALMRAAEKATQFI